MLLRNSQIVRRSREQFPADVKVAVTHRQKRIGNCDMITVPISNTVLFLSEDEADNLREQLGIHCHAAELQGEGIIRIPDLLAVSVGDARLADRQLGQGWILS